MVDATIFDKRPNFMGIFLVTSLIGIMLISLAVYNASRELEAIHEVDNMYRVIHSVLGEEKIEQILRANHAPLQIDVGLNPYRFLILSDKHIEALQTEAKEDVRRLESIDLEDTRVNERGGYFEADNNTYTWAAFTADNSTNQLLVVHTFSSEGVSAIAYVYKKRMIIPVLFYVWLMIWVSLIFNHLLKKLKTQQKLMKHLALHDSLTSLANRSLMEDRLLKLIQVSHRENKKFAFSIIDIDGFKAINDNHGHAYGDELLRQVAKRLKSIMRESDTAARLGGDEFTIMLNNIDEKAWHAAFMRAHTVLIEPYKLFDTTVTVSVSIGVAIYSVHGDDADTLFRHADEAMYVAKAASGGIHLFEELEIEK